MDSFKKQAYNLMEDGENETRGHRIFEAFIVSLNLLNAIAMVVESLEVWKNNLKYIETFSAGVFTVAYILRVWMASLKYPHMYSVKASIKNIFSIMGLIDLIAILPFYLNLCLISMDTDGRILRLM